MPRETETHKHRNIIDDLLDLGLLVSGLIYFLFGEKMGLAFSDKELAAVASTGATVRILLRKILLRLTGEQFDSIPGETVTVSAPTEPSPPAEEDDAPSPPAEEDDAPSKDTPKPDADASDEPVVPPPPTTGG